MNNNLYLYGFSETMKSVKFAEKFVYSFRNKKSMKSKPVVMSLLLLCLLAGCKYKTNEENSSTVKNVKTVFPVGVSNVNVRTFPGVVKVANEINLGFKSAGQISRILVKEGDYVREGSIIAELDKKDYLLQLEGSRIQYEQLKTEVERLEKLYERNNISGNDYEKALAGLQALEVQVKANKNTLEYTTLRAPVSGYIQSVNFVKSEMVNAGTPVVTFIDVSSVKVETELPASLFLRQDDFVNYSCRTNLVPGKNIPLQLSGINKKSNSRQLYKMNFVPESSNSGLAPGMNVEVMITMKEETGSGNTCTIPAKAVFKKGDNEYVWTVENNVARRKEVETGGVDHSGRIIILSGISERDEIIVAGLRVIEEGDRVNIIPLPAETNKGGLL